MFRPSKGPRGRERIGIRHIRLDAIMRSTPVVRCQRSPLIFGCAFRQPVSSEKDIQEIDVYQHGDCHDAVGPGA